MTNVPDDFMNILESDLFQDSYRMASFEDNPFKSFQVSNSIPDSYAMQLLHKSCQTPIRLDALYK